MKRTVLVIAMSGTVVGTAPTESQSQLCALGAPVVFVDAGILTMDTDIIIRGTTVVVRDGKVSAINPTTLPTGACRIMARGKVLMPGLTDMHVHTSEREMPLFLANGVTFIREMNGSPTLVILRDRIARGEVVGPRMLVTSPLLVGTPLQYRHRLITSADDAYHAAHEAKDAGYDYLKIYDGLSRAAYAAFVEAGRTLKLPLDGHIPEAVGLEAVLNAGQSIQHMDKIVHALGGPPGDSTKLTEARRLFTGRRTWVTPTLASLRVLDGSHTTEYAAWFDRPEIAYVDAGSLGWWRSLSGTRPPTPVSPFYRFQMALLPVLRNAGARFLLGTDAANPMMIAGFSVHEELATLVRDGGFTVLEALRAATKNVGEFLGDSLRGRLVSGAPADLVLIDSSPLDDLAVLRRPAGVMANGRWFGRPQLDSMLAAAKLR